MGKASRCYGGLISVLDVVCIPRVLIAGHTYVGYAGVGFEQAEAKSFVIFDSGKFGDFLPVMMPVLL